MDDIFKSFLIGFACAIAFSFATFPEKFGKHLGKVANGYDEVRIVKNER